ncbi:MAG TPA: double-strand break repair helicase AddA [Methylocella sp.]|nr:double-strand break repair helicase AddA [Methylocella sp.]
MPFPIIPSDTLRRQHEAANPSCSVWVSANAGSGKTHVLASRVIRLLLEGVPPSKILCLTYTRAAAANMSARVFETLARWTSQNDEDLRSEIASIGAPPPGAAGLILARKLFARAVETPGGLKIQTIHAFCERLLHLFPFEANVPARFEVADDEKRDELLQRARQHVLAEANAGRGSLGAALLRLTDELGQHGFEDLLTEAMKHSGILCAGRQKGLTEILREILDIPKGSEVATIEHEMIEGWLPPDCWLEFAEKLDQSSKNDQKCAKQFRTAYAAFQDAEPGDETRCCLDAYLAVFFTQTGTPRASVATGSFASAHPAIAAALRCEQERLTRLDARRKSAAVLERTRALIEIASVICRRYQEEKAAQGILDFQDLIDRTLALLDRSDARWVLYKLDSGIDHILVDEAQDTSEPQWRILEALTDEFTAGAGQVQGARTFFAVGDEKQSIFSFQGAAHHMFDEMRQSFQKRFLNGARDFQHVQLTHSFRSVPGVLSVIDEVFEHDESHRSGVVAPGAPWMPHESLKERLPGLVEVWPLAKKSADEAPSGWHVPQQLSGSHEPASLVAQRIAEKISFLTSAWPQDYVHEGRTQRPVQARDILILVRRRGSFFEAMIRALKSAGIPSAGADRLEIHHHIAVMDLVAAGRASLLPVDDLTLACVLKSPLVGLDDDDLLALAPCRKGSLFDALRNASAEKHAEAFAKLARWRARAGDGAFAFYAALLGADGGRRDMEARLGPEATDAIDEFMRLALEHEAANPPSLAAFLNYFEGIEHSIKRDMDSGANMVRVMTVHAAKGLEAKIVFLVDDCTVFSARHEPQIFVLDSKVPGERTIAWSPRKELDCASVAAAREREREASFKEYKRLLYVALSRAEERLYVAGFHRRKEPDKDCWSSMIRAALAGKAGAEEVPAFWNPEERILRLAFGARGSASVPEREQGRKEPAAPAVPEWLLRPAPAGVSAAPRLRPSYALSPEGSGGKGARGNLEGQRRGRLIHLLLQHLPAIAPDERRHAAGVLLSARAPWLGIKEREALCSEALDVLRLPELEELFGPCSLAEVPVAGRIVLGNRQAEVAGRIDRLYEGMSDVLAADFKTGAPCSLDDMPEDYLAQMALYRALLAPLWPGKTLRMLLIWTAGPSVLWLPPERLDAALAMLAG